MISNLKTRTVHGEGRARCDGVSRRDLLAMGVLTSLGLGLPDLFRLRAAAAAPGTPRAESCILIWLDGGPSHLDTFDPKPDAPAEVRGEFQPIETSVPGLRIAEHLPRLAREMHRVALVRTLTHELGNHDTGSQYLLTGHRPGPILEYPSLGSVVARETGLDRPLPPYVAVPDSVAAGRAGYLPASFAPFSVGGDPGRAEYRVRDLQPPVGFRLDRADRRRAMVRDLDRFAQHVEQTAATRSRDSFFAQAERLTTSPAARAAFDLAQEPGGARERYGRGRLGAGCLLARRLVEAGCRFVTVVDTGWDTHQQVGKALPDAFFPGSGKLPAMDRACAALLTDLHDRGLLERTLVLMLGEFGRTPKLNSAGGRDHWPRAGFALAAGAGIPGGQAIGTTDPHGEAPVDRPVTPPDLAASVYRLLGVDPHKEYVTGDGRPMRILTGGEPLREFGLT